MQRKGAVLPLIAILMLAMILVLGLMVELTWFYSSRFEAQSASDLAARSALARLYENSNALDQAAIDEAKTLGVEVYGLNFRSNPISIDQLSFGVAGSAPLFVELDQQDQFRDITASRVEHQQEFSAILGTLMAKNQINMPVRSVAEANRIELVLCLDASRSMNNAVDQSAGKFPPGAQSIHEPPLAGSRWFALEDAVSDFLQEFSGGVQENGSSQLALVTFGGGLTPAPTPVSPLDATFARVDLNLDSFRVNSPLTSSTMRNFATLPALGFGTSIFDGLDESVTILENSTTPARQFIVLFTDGNQVVRGQRPSELVAGQRAVDSGIPVFTIAFSTNGTNLQTISNDTGGLFFAVDSEAELRQAFSTIAASLGARITQ